MVEETYMVHVPVLHVGEGESEATTARHGGTYVGRLVHEGEVLLEGRARKVPDLGEKAVRHWRDFVVLDVLGACMRKGQLNRVVATLDGLTHRRGCMFTPAHIA